MARPQKNNVEYFPFLVKEGKTATIIKTRYGKDGWTVWTRTLRQLAITDYHYLDFNEELTLSFMAADTWTTEEQYKQIISDLVKFKEFDQTLWENGILYSEPFIERLRPAYQKRENKPLTPGELHDHLISLGTLKPGFRYPNEKDTPKNPEKPPKIAQNEAKPIAGAKTNPPPKPGKSTPKPGKSTPKPRKDEVSGVNNTQRKEKKRKDIREMSKSPKKSDPKTEKVPYQKILSLYHTILPELPKVQTLTDKRKRYLKARWKEHPDITWWEKVYMPKIRDSDFLMYGKDSWRGADFDFIINSSKMVKILEGNYDNFKNKNPRGNGQHAYRKVAQGKRHEKPEHTIS